ncbi:hypothetical protein BH20GEM2_BH20GEM2_09470 [soil metagenome]
MEVRRMRVADGAASGRVRLTAEVRYDGGLAPEEYWFEVAAAVAGDLSNSGNPWLVAMLPLAAMLGEPLRLEAPAEAGLIDNARRVMEIWRAWYPDVEVVEIDADPLEDGDSRSPGRVGAFFSGGVDSFFTALRPRDKAAGAERIAIDELLTVRGFDIPLSAAEAFSGLRETAARAARELGYDFLDVATNLRTGRWDGLPWGPLGHGCALVGTALALENRYGAAVVPATGGYRDLHPWGSHPLTDPLLSTNSLRIIHDGAAFTRVDKLRLLTDSPTALRALRVCWESRSDRNCGACPKCIRTMAVLDLLGVLNRCDSFPCRRVAPRAVARLRCGESWDYRELRDLRDLALQVGRGEMVKAAEGAMRRSHVRGWFRKGALSLARKAVPSLPRGDGRGLG